MDAMQSLMADPTTRPRSAKARSATVYRTVAVGAALTALGLLAPTAIHSPYYLGLLINAIMLAISAVSIGFLAHQSGLMMFGAAAFTGSATYLYAIAITQFGWNVMAASAFTLYLDLRVTREFEGRRFALPARIYARPLELHAGLRISPADVLSKLQELPHVRQAKPLKF